MKLQLGPVETKVAAGGGMGGLITLLFSLAAQYHWFTPPGPQLTGLIITAAGLLAGWLAPPTPRTPAQPGYHGPVTPVPAPAVTTTGPGPVRVTTAAKPPPERTAP